VGARPHGSRARYIRGCRCTPCKRANAAYEAKRVLGYTSLVDATPTREHIVVLREAGVGLSRITQLTGIARQTIQAILRGRPERGNRPAQQVKRDTAERILALDPVNPDLAAGTPVDATGARRRIQALVCAGWSFPLLAERYGSTADHVRFLARADRLYLSTVRRITELFEELWDVAPPEQTEREQTAAAVARRHARRRQWAPAMAWDDETIDDPAAEPQGTDVDHAPRLGLPPGEDLLWLFETESVEEIARRFNVRKATVQTAIARAREKAA
jgi:hypothetical protein